MWLLCIFLSSFLGKEGILSFIYAFLFTYVGHLSLHDDLFYFFPYSILHRYHHDNKYISTYISNILSEFSMMTSFLLLPTCIGISINPWSILFNWIIYTSVHYINYSWFHINEYHEKHHDQIETNIYPDILDALFGTKHIDTPLLEKVTHVLPNIVIAFNITLWIKHHYHESWKPKMYTIWTIIFILLLIHSGIILTNLNILYSSDKNNVFSPYSHTCS
jgi:hypothetical protein